MHSTLFPPLACLAALTLAASAQTRLPALISDHMVLQRESTVNIWGWDAPGRTVAIKTSWGFKGEILTDARGRWSMPIITPAAGPESHSMTFTGSSEVTVRDVLMGEVWVCSGQSNMEWSLAQAAGGPEEASKADHPTLRLFNVPNVTSLSPLEDVKGQWQLCSPSTAGGFTAVGYHFARALQKELDVPIGLLQSDWGGTPAESWASAASLDQFKEYEAMLGRIKESAPSAATPEQAAAIVRSWYTSLPSYDQGSKAIPSWESPALDDAAWEQMIVPGPWEGPLARFDGIVWFRSSIDLPEGWATTKATLELGAIDDCDVVWINGTKVGSTLDDRSSNTPRSYEVPASVLKAGANQIAVCILDTGGPGGFAGTANQMRLRSDQGQDLPLAGAWKFKPGNALSRLPSKPEAAAAPHTPTVLFNGMIAPICRYTIQGTIWYQGESNVGRAAQYQQLFPAMVKGWRAAWKQEFPFYFVQIAPYGYDRDKGQAALLREAQLLASQSIANSGMAVTMDLGNPRDIHPSNKLDVGQRLARLAQHRTYGKTQIDCEGPSYRSMKQEGSTIRIEFDHAEGLSSGSTPPAHFTICGSDHTFVPATATIDGTTVVVQAAGVDAPVAVRYAWGASDEGTLRNAAGLPASSFRPDSFEK